MSVSFKKISFACAMAMMAACSGSGSSSSSGATSATTADLASLTTVPRLDVDALDVAGDASASMSRFTETRDGEFSRANCEVRSMVKEIKDQADEFNVNMCIMSSMETNTAMEVGNGSYNYYRVSFGDAPEGEDHFPSETLVKVGHVGGRLQLALCENGTQNMVLDLGVEGGKFVGSITSVNDDDSDGISDSHRVSVNVPDIASATDLTDGDSASIVGETNGYWGAGSITLNINRDGDTITNAVTAAFRNGGDAADFGEWTTIAAALYDNEVGSATYEATGSQAAAQVQDYFGEDAALLAEIQTSLGLGAEDYFCWVEAEDPATADSVTDWIGVADENNKCTFTDSGTESWNYVTADNGVVIPNEDSVFYDDVVLMGADLTQEDPEIAFGDLAWDCTAAGSTFVDIDVSENDTLMAAVETCQGDRFDRGSDMTSCHEEERSHDAGDDLGQEFDDQGGDQGGEGAPM